MKEELEARNLSAASLALRLRVPPQRIPEIVAGKRGLSPETAFRLDLFFGNEPEFWLSMQTANDLAILRRDRSSRIAADVEVAP